MTLSGDFDLTIETGKSEKPAIGVIKCDNVSP